MPLSDPHEFFRNIHSNPGYCLLLRPFRPELRHFWAAVAKAFDKTFYWTDIEESNQTGAIVDDILKKIGEHDCVIVDVTGDNPNVFYELGVAHMVRGARKVVIIRQKRSAKSEQPSGGREPEHPPPFDIRGDRYLEYDLDNVGELLPKLESTIYQALERTAWFRIAEGETYSSDAMRGKVGAYSFSVRTTAFLDRSVGYQLKAGRNVRSGSVAIEVTVRPYPDEKQTQRAVVKATLESASAETCKIPNLPWRLKFEYFEREGEQDKAVICVLPEATVSRRAS